MRKYREFDNVLNECLERLLVKGETMEQCLGSFPEHSGELKPLLETALAAKKASAIQPRPEFRDRARYQFYSELQAMERKRSRPFFGWLWQPRWVPVTAVVLALLLAGGGTVAAASGSMPDEPLYAVKLATEQVQLVFTPSALGKAELYARLADRRVTEIVRMAGKSKPEHIERATQLLDTYLTKIAVLSSLQEVTGEVAMAPAFEEAPLPEEALAVEETPAMLRRGGGVKGKGIGLDRRGRLWATVVRLNHPARLRAALDTAPQSVRPALLRAITVSQAGYEKALESLD